MPANARYLFVYLISCPYVTLINYFEVPIQYISLEMGLTDKEINQAKKELEKTKRAYFYKNWVYIPNLTKHNRYHVSTTTYKAYNEELKRLPLEVVEYFNKLTDSTIIPVSVDNDSTQKQEIRNNKQEIRNQKEENITKEEKNIEGLKIMREALKVKLKI